MDNTISLICLGIWFAFMLFGSLGIFYWACFGKIDNDNRKAVWWE